MLRTPLEERSKFTINVRPVKIAYFVRDHDTESLTRILRFICTQWGGIRNVIIPVLADLTIAPIFQKFLQVHEPDKFVSYLDEEKVQSTENQRWLRRQMEDLFPGRSIDIHNAASFESRDRTAHPLSMFNMEDIKRYRTPTPKFFGGEEVLLPDCKLGGNGVTTWMQLALYGAVYPGQEELYQKLFTLNPIPVDVGTELFWQDQVHSDPFSSILNLTGYGVVPRGSANASSAYSNHLDVVLVNSVTSACLFWNLRGLRESVQVDKGLGRRTLLLPDGLLNSDESAMTFVAFARRHLPVPGVSANVHLLFYTADPDSHEHLRSVLANVPSLESFTGTSMTVNRTAPRKAEDLSQSSLLYDCADVNGRFFSIAFPDSFKEGVDPNPPILVSLQHGSNELLFTPPDGFRNRFRGAVAVDFECDVWNRYPQVRRVAEAIKSYSWFSHRGLSMLMGVSGYPNFLTFDLPDEWDSLRHFFGSKGYGIRETNVSRHADAVVDLASGSHGVDILASKPVYLLLDMLALKSTKKIAQRIVKDLNLRNPKPKPLSASSRRSKPSRN